jgi:hypothetical protein
MIFFFIIDDPLQCTAVLVFFGSKHTAYVPYLFFLLIYSMGKWVIQRPRAHRVACVAGSEHEESRDGDADG